MDRTDSTLIGHYKKRRNPERVSLTPHPRKGPWLSASAADIMTAVTGPVHKRAIKSHNRIIHISFLSDDLGKNRGKGSGIGKTNNVKKKQHRIIHMQRPNKTILPILNFYMHELILEKLYSI